MKKSNKKLAKILAVIMIVASFAACAQSGPAVTETPADSGQTDNGTADTPVADSGSELDANAVNITYWGWDTNFYEVMGPAFEKANSGQHVEITPLAHADYLTKIQQSVASGAELPDILLGESNLRGKLFELDIWEDLSQAPYNVTADMFFDFIVRRTSNSSGAIVGIEQSVSPAAMAYKRDLAAEYLGTDDRAEIEAMFTTMDSYAEVAKKVQEASNGEVYLFHSTGLVMEWLYFSDDTPIVNEAGELDFTAKMSSVLTNMEKLIDAGAIDKFQMGTPQGNAAYAGANHIFYPCPNWAIDYYIKSNDPNGAGNWGLSIPATGGYSAGGTVMGINKNSPNKEAAWDFIKWCTMVDEGVLTARDEINYYVPSKTFYTDETFVSKTDDFFAGQDIGDILYNEIVPNIKVAATSPHDTVMYDVTQLLAQSMIANPDMTAEQAVQKGIEEVQNKLPDVTVV